MDCYESGNDSGCNGGDPWDLYLYIIEKGLEPASAYPIQIYYCLSLFFVFVLWIYNLVFFIIVFF